MARPSTVRAALREPLLHFVLLGALLFAAQSLLHGRRDASTIVVTGETRRELVDGFTRANGHPPSPEEEKTLVAKWVDEEVLYRAGTERGLAKDDPRIRLRVADKMGFVLASKLVLPSPSQGELQAWFQAHRDRWAKAARVDFVQVFVTGSDEAARKRADELVGKLREGADPAGLGDRFSGGRHYRGRTIESLRAAFGEGFVAGLEQQEPGTWVQRESRFGFHLVRVERWTNASVPTFDAVEQEVLEDWQRAKKSEALAREVSELRRQYRIVEQP